MKYLLSNNIKKSIDISIKNTKKTGKEHGFDICLVKVGVKDKNNRGTEKLKTGKKYTGNNNFLKYFTNDDQIVRCKEGRHIGIFHTHTDLASPQLSLNDIHVGCKIGHEISCVSNKNGNMSCYHFKGDRDKCIKDTSVMNETILDNMMRSGKVNKKTEKLYEHNLNKIPKKYYKEMIFEN